MRLLPSEGTAQSIGGLRGAWDSFCPWSGCAVALGPNNALQLTAYSLRSCVAPAFGSR
jgi:hypothetical protein